VPERRVARRARRTRPLSRSQGSLCGLCGPRRLRRDHRQPLRDVTAPGRPFDRGCAEINARIATAGSLSIRLSGGCVFLSISFPPLSSAYASAYIPPPHPPPSPPSVDAFTSINPRLLSGWRALREGSAHHRGSIEIYRRYLRAIHAHGSDAEAFAIDSRCSGIPEADIAHVIRVIPLTDPREKSRRFSPRVLSLCRPSVLWLALSFLRADS